MSDDRAPVSALPGEQEAAFRLLLSHCPPDQLPRRLVSSLQMLQTGEIGPDGLMVLRRDSRVIGAIAATVVPGGTGLLWPPRALEGQERDINEDCLTRSAVQWLTERGACLAQALLHPDEAFLAGPLLRNGFRHVTSLAYLDHDHELPASLIETPPRLIFQTYAQANPAEFRSTMARTFEGTLDCPEVTEARSIEEVIVGFQAQGVFDASGWWLARHGHEPVGVLLTTEVPEENAWEICYVGIVPEARRRGYGREMVLKALLEARAVEVTEVFLTVDARNKPAWGVYRSLGFEPFDRREVFLMLLPRRL